MNIYRYSQDGIHETKAGLDKDQWQGICIEKPAKEPELVFGRKIVNGFQTMTSHHWELQRSSPSKFAGQARILKTLPKASMNITDIELSPEFNRYAVRLLQVRNIHH